MLQGLIKMEKLHTIYPKYYNLLIAQDLWKAYYQILSTTFLKEFIKLNLNTDTLIKNVEIAESNKTIVTVFLDTKTLKDDLIEYKCLYCDKHYKQKFT